MRKNMHAAWTPAGLVALAVLAILLIAAPVEAKFKAKVKSGPKAPSAPSVSMPHVPDAPKPQTDFDRALRIPRVNVSVTSQTRGYFQRIWDWLFGRRPAPAPTPAVAPATPAPRPAPVAPAPAPAPAPPSAVAVTPAAPGTAPVIVPVALPGAVPPAPGAQAALQDKEGKAPDKLPELPTVEPSKPEPVVKGYIVHLKNGRRIPTIHYEDKGRQVVIPWYGGTFGLSKSLIKRIEVVKENP
jgi:hypothetical protein